MDLSTVLLLMTGVALVIFALRLFRLPWRQVWDWWAVLAVVSILAFATYLAWPAGAGYAAFGSIAILVFLPLRLDRAANRAARAGRDARARWLSRVAASLHPLGGVGSRPAAIAAAARLRAGGGIDEATLKELDRDGDPGVREAYRVAAMNAAADYQGIRLALALPSRRTRLVALGLGTTWLRAVAETAERESDVLDALDEVERRDATLEDAERRALLALEASAALGDVSGARRTAAAVSGWLPAGGGARAVAAAQRVAGDLAGARATAEAALSRTDLDVATRKALVALGDSLGSFARRGDAPERAQAALARLSREADAVSALSPLEGGEGRSVVTWTLAAAMVGWFVVVTSRGDVWDPAHLARHGGLLVPLDGPWSVARMFSCTFVHAGLLHLGLNVYALLAFGRFAESFYGKGRMLAIWVASTLTSGGAVAALADPARPSILVGASGAIFGLGGAMVSAVLLREDLRRSRRGREELRSFAVLLGLQLVFDRVVPAVSGTAHLAGLVGGALFGALLVPRPPPREAPPGTNDARGALR